MKKLAFGMVAIASGLAIGVAGAAVERVHATTIRVSGVLTAAEEVPAPRGDVSAARGTFTATATRSGTGAVLEWQLAFGNTSGPALAAHIHVAPRGEAGPVVVPLCAPCESAQSGSATVDAALVSALESGRAYANVHTRTNPAGEIRAQLAVVAQARAALNPRQEVPRPKGAVRRARGSFAIAITKPGPTATASWRLTYRRLSGRAIAAHIHIGARGKAGPVVLRLCAPCRTGARGSATIGSRVLAALESGRAYVNVHTPRNQAGEVRGQIPAVALRISNS